MFTTTYNNEAASDAVDKSDSQLNCNSSNDAIDDGTEQAVVDRDSSVTLGGRRAQKTERGTGSRSAMRRHVTSELKSGVAGLDGDFGRQNGAVDDAVRSNTTAAVDAGRKEPMLMTNSKADASDDDEGVDGDDRSQPADVSTTTTENDHEVIEQTE